MNIKILIVSPTAELPRYHEFYDSMDKLILPPYTDKLPIHTSSPAKNRNIAIERALEIGTYTHLFFTDDDHVYAPDTLMRLLAHNVDIVSGLYCMKVPPFPLVALSNPNDKNMSSFVDFTKVPPFQLIEVPRVPAGCLLVTTRALTAIAQSIKKFDYEFDPRQYKNKWFTLGHIQPDEWGDDLWFCDRAREADLKIYIDTGVTVGHITKCVLEPKWNGEEWEIRHMINAGYHIGDPNAKKG